MPNIIFTPTKTVAKEFYPVPSSKAIGDWYKKTTSYSGGAGISFDKEANSANTTIKKCMPFFDAMTAGYTIFTHTDLFISQDESGVPFYNWKGYDAIEFHSPKQISEHPEAPNHLVPKWMNPWAIKTPKNYSCFFSNPMHRDKSPINIIEGIVDTDSYTSPVNFPFMLKDWSYRGLVPAGTPIAQVIPFKRESWEMQISQDSPNHERFMVDAVLFAKYVNAYKNHFWAKKEFK
jgi:hypothetical protein